MTLRCRPCSTAKHNLPAQYNLLDDQITAPSADAIMIYPAIRCKQPRTAALSLHLVSRAIATCFAATGASPGRARIRLAYGRVLYSLSCRYTET